MSKSLVKQAIELCDEEEVSNHKRKSKFNFRVTFCRTDIN